MAIITLPVPGGAEVYVCKAHAVTLIEINYTKKP